MRNIGKNSSYDVLRGIYESGVPVGQSVNRFLMQDLMAIGGMPQAVDAYISRASFSEIDFVKRRIIDLYENDFYRIDPSGMILLQSPG